MPSFINGPFNYIHLTGNIKGIKKSITIFMDVHLDINNQTRCDSFDSIDISQYLYNLIKQTKVPLDFFLEVRQEQLREPTTDRRDIYIAEVIEMFKSEFITEKDSVKYSKSNDKVRLHYLDIRDHLKFIDVTNQLNKHVLPKLNSLKNDKLNESEKNNILNYIKLCIENIRKNTFEILEKYISIKNNNITDLNKNSKEYYLDKIIHKYKHKTVKTNINNFFNNFYISYNSEFNKLINDFIFYIIYFNNDIYNQSNLEKLFELYNKLKNNLFALYAIITDVFFLRRILDKDYIQNTVTYCGRNHALNYIYFLVKYYDFIIQNIYNTNGLTLDAITNKIKETDDINKIYNMFLFEGEKPKQCVEKPNYELINLGW
jgi:hypothetical protein